MRKLAVGAASLLFFLVPAVATADPVDLTGKKLIVTCSGMDDPTLPNPWVLEIIFDAGRPGEDVDATLTNPPQKEYEISPGTKYRGTYSADGRLDMMLYPNKLHTSGVDLKIDSRGRVSGKCARGYGFLHLFVGTASGSCVDCDSRGQWSAGTALSALALFLAGAAYVKHLEEEKKKKAAQPKVTLETKPVIIDTSDPWHDLPKSERRIIRPDE